VQSTEGEQGSGLDGAFSDENSLIQNGGSSAGDKSVRNPERSSDEGYTTSWQQNHRKACKKMEMKEKMVKQNHTHNSPLPSSFCFCEALLCHFTKGIFVSAGRRRQSRVRSPNQNDKFFLHPNIFFLHPNIKF